MGTKPTKLTVNPVDDVPWGAYITLSGKLTDESGQKPLEGKAIQLSSAYAPVDWSIAPMPTSTKGGGKFEVDVLTEKKTPSSQPFDITLRFAGDDEWKGTHGNTVYFYTVPHDTSVILCPIDNLLTGEPKFKAVLTDTNTGVNLSNREVHFSGSGVIPNPRDHSPNVPIPVYKTTVKTDSNGQATFTGVSPEFAGPFWTYQANFYAKGQDDPHYKPSKSEMRFYNTKIKLGSVRFAIKNEKNRSVTRDASWSDDIVGFDGLDHASIKVIAHPKNKLSAPPQKIKVEVKRRPPKLYDHSGKITTDDKDPNVISVALFSLTYDNGLSSLTSTPATPASTIASFVYTNDPKHNITIVHPLPPSPSNSLPPPSKPLPNSNRLSVASLVRGYDKELGSGDSDKHFRKDNRFVNRGSAVETGPDKDSERPHPRKLFLTGGVEVLEVKVIVSSITNIMILDINLSHDKMLVRSPANIFYYSGHGHSNLLNPPGVLTSTGGDPISVDDLLNAGWKKSKFSMKALIIAGCSVISLHQIVKMPIPYPPWQASSFLAKNRKGVGKQWARLLSSQQGPVDQILGYWGSAPSDKNGGNDLAYMLGYNIDYLRSPDMGKTWLELHKTKFGSTQTSVSVLKDNVFSYIEYIAGNIKIVEDKIVP